VWLVLAVAVAAMALAGCGEAASQQPARLAVWERLPPHPWYIEGTVAFLHVESVESGEVLVDGPVTDPSRERGKAPLFSAAVEPGSYRLLSHQRPCQGNCSMLDPPVDRCKTTVRVDGPVTATVVLAQEGGCEIRLGR